MGVRAERWDAVPRFPVRAKWSAPTAKSTGDRPSTPKSLAHDQYEQQQPRAHQTHDPQLHDAQCPLHNSSRPCASVTTMDVTAFCWFFCGDELIPVLNAQRLADARATERRQQ